MKRNLTRQADLQLRRFCHRLTVKQRKAVLWILFVPFAAACVYYCLYRLPPHVSIRHSGRLWAVRIGSPEWNLWKRIHSVWSSFNLL